jgi:hypothetical protein
MHRPAKRHTLIATPNNAAYGCFSRDYVWHMVLKLLAPGLTSDPRDPDEPTTIDAAEMSRVLLYPSVCKYWAQATKEHMLALKGVPGRREKQTGQEAAQFYATNSPVWTLDAQPNYWNFRTFALVRACMGRDVAIVGNPTRFFQLVALFDALLQLSKAWGYISLQKHHQARLIAGRVMLTRSEPNLLTALQAWHVQRTKPLMKQILLPVVGHWPHPKGAAAEAKHRQRIEGHGGYLEVWCSTRTKLPICKARWPDLMCGAYVAVAAHPNFRWVDVADEMVRRATRCREVPIDMTGTSDYVRYLSVCDTTNCSAQQGADCCGAEATFVQPRQVVIKQSQ